MIARILALMLVASIPISAQVSFDRVVRADREPQNWLTYTGNLLGQRHSPLTQLTPANVKDLEL